MWKQVLTGVLLIAAGAQASTLEELRQLEAHKTTPGKASQIQAVATSSSPVAPAAPERRDYRLPDGRVVNLKNYKLVLFMQSRCGYCQQFDPLLKRVTAQLGLDVFPYTLDGMGDVSFPDAIPATEAVIRDMWSNMRPVTPAAFLVEVNTLKTLPLLYGIVDEQVSASPKEITWQQISNFLHGGAGINYLCRQHGFQLMIVDAGVDYDLPAGKGIVAMKVRRGTRNFLHEAAMTEEEFQLCLERGAKCVDLAHADGCNVVSFGEMGIGNTSASSLWMTCLTGIPLEQCVGAGSGLQGERLAHKYEVLRRSLDRIGGTLSPVEVMCQFGGYEMVMAVGGMLRAAEQQMVILVDGFIMTNCLLAASKLNPLVLQYAVYGHQGDESGHKLVLDYLQARPLLNLGLRLGEGSGAVCAYPILDSAVRMMNEMDTFGHASITKYF